ncbi:methionine synthase [Candidatus Gracilibacteria bacterium]|nr:methionine synthase [Candidatus Gracilibacteria bacterium]
MNRGIYIVANDKVLENAIALLNSIRYYDPDVTIFLIPFNEQYQEVANILKQKHNVEVFPDLELIARITKRVGEIFDRDFLSTPNKMRKLVQWFGPLDEFLYIDTDILVFEKISDILNYLSEYEFICCDYHYKKRKLIDIFSPLVKEKEIFSDRELEDVFNSGFWASKKGIFSEEKLYELLTECAQNREYFDFSSKTTDQPILNYLILKSTQKRLNLVKISDKESGSWAGSKHFIEKKHILYDGDKRLRYLHWAGMPMVAGGAYRELWEYYRYLGENKPLQIASPPQQKSQWENLIARLKKQIKKAIGKGK